MQQRVTNDDESEVSQVMTGMMDVEYARRMVGIIRALLDSHTCDEDGYRVAVSLYLGESHPSINARTTLTPNELWGMIETLMKTAKRGTCRIQVTLQAFAA